MAPTKPTTARVQDALYFSAHLSHSAIHRRKAPAFVEHDLVRPRYACYYLAVAWLLTLECVEQGGQKSGNCCRQCSTKCLFPHAAWNDIPESTAERWLQWYSETYIKEHGVADDVCRTLRLVRSPGLPSHLSFLLFLPFQHFSSPVPSVFPTMASKSIPVPDAVMPTHVPKDPLVARVGETSWIDSPGLGPLDVPATPALLVCAHFQTLIGLC